MKVAPLVIVIGFGVLCTYVLFKKKKVNKDDIIIDLEDTSDVKPISSIEEEPLPTIEESVQMDLSDEEEPPPYDNLGFGLDSRRNIDNNELDDYMNLPLVGSSKTHTNYVLADIDPPKKMPPTLVKYKYLRLTIKETRGKTNTTHIGHVHFYRGKERVKDTNINIWNPYTGDRDIYKGPWDDSDTKCVVFYFIHPVAINRYDIKTSFKPPSNDPAIWTLEGSKNASYWVLLSSEEETLPMRRAQTSSFYLDDDLQ